MNTVWQSIGCLVQSFKKTLFEPEFIVFFHGVKLQNSAIRR